METTFYDESRAAFRGGPEPRGMKRPVTLDLDGPRASSKKLRGSNAQLLTSPDMNMLKLESPELEKLIIQQHGLAGGQGQCMYPNKDDDREQQQYPRDFPDALGGLSNNMHLYQQQLQSELLGNACGILPQSTTSTLPPVSMVDTSYHGGYHSGHHQQQHQQQPLSTINTNCTNNPMVSSTMGGSNCYVTGGYYTIEPMLSIKEEPQTVPCVGGPSPPQSPIDMEDQERLKLERKRLRNRIAASKCRRRKLERIARLEDKVSRLKSENSELTNHVSRLREHVCQLKQQVMDHIKYGCEIRSSFSTAFGDEL